MYPISLPVKEAFASGAMQYARVTVNAMEIETVVENDDIKQGGLIINRYCTTSDTLNVGSCVAAELTLVLDNYDGTYDDISYWKGGEAYVEIGVEVGNTISYVPMGYFIFDSVTFGRSDVTLTALDRLILFEKEIGTLTFPMTLSALLSACCTACGVTLASGSLTNGSYTVSALPEEARTYRDLLKWIFEIAGCCGYINRGGALAYAWYSPVTFDLTQAMRKHSTLDKQSIVITGIEITDGDTVYTSGVTDRMIRINNNPLLKASQQAIADSIYQKCGGLTYVPFTATIVPSPQLFILDMPLFMFPDGTSFVYVAISEITYRLNGYTEIAGTGGKGVYPYSYGLSEAILNASNMKGGTLPPDRIGDSAITGMKIAAQAVTEGKIAANAVTEGKIAANAVVAGKIASGAVTADKIAANAVTAGKILAGAVTADKISIADLYALGATIGGWEITQNAMRKITTIGQYDYQIILYAPTSPQLTTSAVAIQRRATGTSDAWASVTRMTFAGKLISNDAEITGALHSGDGDIGGWTITSDSIQKEFTYGGQTYTCKLSTATVNNYSNAIEITKGNDTVFSVTYGGALNASVIEGNYIDSVQRTVGSDVRESTVTLDGTGVAMEDTLFDPLDPQVRPSRYASMSTSDDEVASVKLSAGDDEGTIKGGVEMVADSDNNKYNLVAYKGLDSSTSSTTTSKTTVSDSGVTIHNGTSLKSEFTKDSLKVNGVSYSTPTSGSGTRNTTNTTGGVCEYWKIGKVVVVSFRQLVPAVTTADAILFTGLPNAVADTSFPAIATTARGAGRLYVDTSGRIKIGGNMSTAGTYLGNFTYVSA